MVPAAMERYAALHILLNNVGGSGVGPVVEVDEDVWCRALEINLKTRILTSKYTIPKMIGTGSCSIINIS